MLNLLKCESLLEHIRTGYGVPVRNHLNLTRKTNQAYQAFYTMDIQANGARLTNTFLSTKQLHYCFVTNYFIPQNKPRQKNFHRFSFNRLYKSNRKNNLTSQKLLGFSKLLPIRESVQVLNICPSYQHFLIMLISVTSH